MLIETIDNRKQTIFIAPQHISTLTQHANDSDRTIVIFQGDGDEFLIVEEPLSEFVRKYKAAMEDHNGK